jgi:hypothetical protein
MRNHPAQKGQDNVCCWRGKSARHPKPIWPEGRTLSGRTPLDWTFYLSSMSSLGQSPLPLGPHAPVGREQEQSLHCLPMLNEHPELGFCPVFCPLSPAIEALRPSNASMLLELTHTARRLPPEVVASIRSTGVRIRQPGDKPPALCRRRGHESNPTREGHSDAPGRGDPPK